jgi:hypothetical protein
LQPPFGRESGIKRTPDKNLCLSASNKLRPNAQFSAITVAKFRLA